MHSSPVSILGRATFGRDKPGIKMNEQHFLAKDNKLAMPFPKAPALTTSHNLSSPHLSSKFHLQPLAVKRCIDAGGDTCGGALSHLLHTHTVTLSQVSSQVAEFFTFCMEAMEARRNHRP